MSYHCECDPHGDNAKCNRECMEPNNMTDRIDTSAEAVERLIWQAAATNQVEMAATLRALMAEKEAALSDWRSEKRMHVEEFERRMEADKARPARAARDDGGRKMTKPVHACFLCDEEYDNPMDAIDCCSPAKRLKAASEIGQTFDPVNKPKHYNSHPSGVETITITEHMNFCLGNVIKYVMRCDLKNGTEDLEKARWYLDREIARRKKAQDV